MISLLPLYEGQATLDQLVAEKSGINIHEDEFVDKRLFALKVELGEFSNETGWFKYWKKSHTMNRAKALEEHADVTHFFLSIGLSRKYHRFVLELKPEEWLDKDLALLHHSIMGNELLSAGRWKIGFEQHFAIGLKLGFSEQEMVDEYFRKNKINVERVKGGY